MDANAVVALLAQTQDAAHVKEATEKLTMLHTHPGFTPVLTQLMAQPADKLDLSVRQMAGVTLKQIISRHWRKDTVKFEPPELSVQDKNEVRRLIVVCDLVGNGESKLRNLTCAIIGKICSKDFMAEDNQWPGLLELLAGYIAQGTSAELQSGALQAISDVAEFIDDDQVPLVAPVLLPMLLQVTQAKDSVPVLVRASAIKTYHILLQSFGTMALQDPNLIKNLLKPTFMGWLQEIGSVFADHAAATRDQYDRWTIQIEALQVLDRFVVDLREVKSGKGHSPISAQLPSLLVPFWQAFHNAVTQFQTHYVHGDQTQDDEAHAASATNGSATGVMAFLEAALEFLDLVSEGGPQVKSSIAAKLPEIVFNLALCQQYTSREEEQWRDEPDSLCCAEDDEMTEFGLRVTCRITLSRFVSNFGSIAGEAVTSAVQRLLSQSQEARQRGDSRWWKARESALLSAAVLSNYAAGQGETAKPIGDMSPFFESFAAQVIVPDLTSASTDEGAQFLRTRAASTASHVASCVSDPLKAALFKGVVGALGKNHPDAVRFFGARAMGSMCADFGDEKRDVIVPCVADALRGCCQLLDETDGDMLHMVLDSLSVVMQVDKAMTAAAGEQCTDLLLQTWSKHVNDPFVIVCVKEVFESIVESPEAVPKVQERVLPAIVNILSNSQQNQPGTVEAAMDILRAVIAPSVGQLPAVFVETVLPRVISLMLHTDDHSILSEGASCVATFLRVAADQILAQQVEGQPMTNIVCQVVVRLLNPDQSDSASIGVGKVVTQLLKHAGQRLGQEGIKQMLVAVIKRFYTAQLSRLQQDLVMVFARLVHQHGADILNFLESIGDIAMDAIPADKLGKDQPAIPAQTVQALPYVIAKWTELQKDGMDSQYARRVTMSALAQLLSFKDARLAGIHCQGWADEASLSSARSTRSSGSKNLIQYKQVPVAVKILSLLCATWKKATSDQELMANAQQIQEHAEFEGGDDFWNETTDEQQGGFLDPNDEDALEKLLMGSEFFDFDEDDFEDDDEATTDPLNKIDLRELSENFVKAFAQQDAATLQQMGSQLNKSDQSTLQSMLQSS